MDISNLKPQQLRRAADLKERIDALREQLNELLGGEVSTPAVPKAPQAPEGGRRKKRRLSPQAIANIRAGVAKRMAKKGGGAVRPAAAFDGGVEAPKKKRQMSAAGRARLSALARARWRKAKAAGKSSL